MRYRHLIWDWNGTILDDFWLCLKVLNIQVERRGLPPVTDKKYKETFGFPIQTHYEANGFDFSLEDFGAVNTEFASEYETRKLECNLRAGAREILKQNCDLGISQSILSALYQKTLNESTKHFGIYDTFTHIRGMNNKVHTGKSKAGKTLLAEIDLPPEKVLYIGDVTADYEAATEMGIDCCLISGTQSYQRLAACSAKAVIESFSELTSIIA